MTIDRKSFPTVVSNIPTHFHPDTIASPFEKLAEGPAASAILSAVNVSNDVYTSLSKLYAVRLGMADRHPKTGQPIMRVRDGRPDISTGGDAGEYTLAASRVGSRLLRMLDTHVNGLGKKCEEMTAARIDALQKKKLPTEQQSEVRTMIRGMGKASMVHLMEHFDASVIHACVTCPPSLVGLSSDQQETLKDLALQRVAPELQESFDAVHKIFGHMSQVRGEVKKLVEGESTAYTTSKAKSNSEARSLS